MIKNKLHPDLVALLANVASFVLFMAISGCTAAICECERANMRVNVKDLRDKNTLIIGSSGLPFGTILRVEGQLISNDTPGKNAPFVKRIRVTHLDGVELTQPYLVNLNTRNYGVGLSGNGVVRLVGYESGKFIGQPTDVWEHLNPPPADTGYGFVEEFVAIRIDNAGLPTVVVPEEPSPRRVP